MSEKLPRRQAIPVLYTHGTHYDVGFDMGHTFGSLIKDFLQLSTPLNEEYLPLYNTPEGRQVYDETLECVKRSFPQYVRELEGIADGAKVEFHKLFLLHLDEILPQSLANEKRTSIPKPKRESRDLESVDSIPKPKRESRDSGGCSSIIMNHHKHRIMGHNEDALSETLNNFYLVVAHITSDSPQGRYRVREERFMSLCYAGHLPGYTMSYNEHGVVSCVNTLAAKYLRSGHTPRQFICRAALAARNFEDVVRILKDTGVGAADGFSINLAFVNPPLDTCYNIEVGPAVEDDKESELDIKEVPVGTNSFHANKYEHIDVPTDNEYMTESSVARMYVFETNKAPTRRKEVLNLLADCSGGEHCVFRENGKIDEKVKTIATGVFDLCAKTFTIYSDNPVQCDPQFTIPMILKDTGCQCMK